MHLKLVVNSWCKYSHLSSFFTLLCMSCHSLSNIYSWVLQSLRIVSYGCSSWRHGQTIKKKNCEVLEVLCKMCCIFYSSVKCMFLWEFLVCFCKILPVGSIRWFWSSTKWLEVDGWNFWFLMIHFFLLVSMLCFSELPVWALSLSDTNELPCSGVSWWIWCPDIREWQKVWVVEAECCQGMEGRMVISEAEWNLISKRSDMQCLDFDCKNSLDQIRSFDYVLVSALHM